MVWGQGKDLEKQEFMETLHTATGLIPYAVTWFYDGGMQSYSGDVVYCDLIAGEITPELHADLEQELVAEASAVLGQAAQITRIVPCIDLVYGGVLKVFFEPEANGRPACCLSGSTGTDWEMPGKIALAA